MLEQNKAGIFTQKTPAIVGLVRFLCPPRTKQAAGPAILLGRGQFTKSSRIASLFFCAWVGSLLVHRFLFFGGLPPNFPFTAEYPRK
jgi:hypothetical protein